MDLKWSLDELYTSFESEDFINDMKKLDSSIKKINDWSEINLNTKDNAIQKIEEYINIQIELNTLFEKLMSFAELTSSVDAKNEKALMIIDKLQTKITELTKPTVKFQRWLNSIENLDKIISSSNILKEHEFYLKEIYNKAKYLLSDEEEILIAKMSNTGSNAWTKLQNILTSTLLVDININGQEKQLPLSIVRNMAYDKDPKIRKTAYEAELKSYKKIEESSAACLNGIKGEVLTVCEMKGYNSPLDMTLIDSRMDRDTLNAMLSAIKESLPTFRKYYKRKAELLGYNNGLPFYELFAPMGEIDMNFTYDEAKDYIVKNFRSFSEKLAEFANNAFENRWIDAKPREGKRGGAFCSNLHPIKQSRILSNFTGSFNDVITLAHELGHGYHGDCLKDESILNSDYPMPLAETASIFCETIVKNAALKEATSKEAFWILEQSISDAGQVIVDIYSRFLFESNLFEKRKDHALSVRELKELMLDAQKEAYGDGLNENYLHPYMWICKPHYYEAAYNFYNFPYAFGLLFAIGLYAEYLKKGKAFIEEYDRLLAATGKNNAVDVAKLMDIDIRSVDFWRSSLKLIEKDIEKFIELSNSNTN
ncbi:oligoendopeptidase, pepF/M3 family [Caloranaerobacter azorensis DSM 13643]|uniref:Oligoendopeptidase, pepF/M3 family n=1 Tax=Caloranaerobacter azorensis DSM 13643 TaxID=1121264 RepID=A0A1M5S145_9FIRM|nr:M3 family oligoendopeptidase [Caloranaerobacter azorensis]SHH32131.1 oligoendopeptidase, pepF/M3 family [Caloranaerobacter azorensis DSM 13643]